MLLPVGELNTYVHSTKRFFMSATQLDQVHKTVRDTYTAVATEQRSGGCCDDDATTSSCCGQTTLNPVEISTVLGYTPQELADLPTGADMGLGCGNPQLIAALQPGEWVLDLGSGGGIDCFLAAKVVGSNGRVIGIDMTPEMLSKARRNAEQASATQVEFRLGEIEYLPVADNTIDVIMSNCVINLSPNKLQVFREAYRVLKTGGRLAISDIVATQEMPEEMRNDPVLYSGCMGGASLVNDLERWLTEAGFQQVDIVLKEGSKAFIREWAPERGVENYLTSAMITAVK